MLSRSLEPRTDTLSRPAQVEAVTGRILDLLLPHRRRPAEPDPADTELVAFAAQRAQIAAFVRADQPVLLTLPGFPCKSPNPRKVLGPLPDEGERLSLAFLDGLCAAIGECYPPGARLVICSDGHVFGELIRVGDATIDAYGTALRRTIRDQGLTRLTTFDLGEMFPDLDHAARRALVDREYAPDLAELREQVRSDAELTRLYRGVTRFLVADATGFTGTASALQRDCRRRAYGVLARSQAWGALVAQRFPRQVRLSIHPQPAGSAKFGIRLLDSSDAWTTPWHACVLTGPDGVPRLVPHHQARRLGTLVWREGRPSHYVSRSTVPAQFHGYR